MILKRNSDIIQNIDFGVTAEAFASGTADYTVEFEPFATSLEQAGNGYVLASLALTAVMFPIHAFALWRIYGKKTLMLSRVLQTPSKKGLIMLPG